MKRNLMMITCGNLLGGRRPPLLPLPWKHWHQNLLLEQEVLMPELLSPSLPQVPKDMEPLDKIAPPHEDEDPPDDPPPPP